MNSLIVHLFLSSLVLLAACSPRPASSTPTPGSQNANYENTIVSLTFDEGDADNYAIRPVLAANNLHATWYIPSGLTGTEGYMTVDQLRDLYADGNEIGGHSLNHTDLIEVRGADLRREVCQDRLNLLALGFKPVSFAYSYGHYDQEALQTVRDCGYNSARIVTDGPDTLPPENPYALKAMPYIVNDTRLPKMQRYVSQTAAAGGAWVIFIFHHVCSGCDEYALEPETFTEFATWLGEQQANGLLVKAIGEVIGGELKPGVEP